METSILGLYWDNGKENGNYYIILGLYWVEGSGFRVLLEFLAADPEEKLLHLFGICASMTSPQPQAAPC